MGKRTVQIPDSFVEAFNRATKLDQEGKQQEAAMAYRECAKACPEVWAAVASKAMTEGRQQEAINMLCQCLEFTDMPDVRAFILNNLGYILSHMGRVEMALRLFEESEALCPTVESWVNKGMILSWNGELEAAEKLYDKAIRKRPDCHEAHFARALAQLARGDYSNGLQNYEARFLNPGSQTRKLAVPLPEWDGGPLDGKRLLVYTEQGFGDSIMMARYGPLLAKRCGWLGLACQKGLRRILAAQGCWDAIMEFGETLPEYDVHIPAMSLPRIFCTRPDSAPNAPYIPLPAPMDLGPGFHVGICWKGSITHKMDHFRSIKLEEWAGLIATPGVTWHSLNVGIGEMDIDRTGLPIQKHSFDDYHQTAEMIAALDLVISVDTSVVHLAGAMGKPAWVLVASSPDWRWMREGETTFWYPSLRLFRQQKRGEWGTVLDQARTGLSELLDPQAAVASL